MSLADNARMYEGIKVGQLAQGLYPGGIVAKYGGDSDEMAAAKTRDLIESGAQTIFEATFIADDRVVRCDVLRRAAEGGWIVDEVKATTGPDAKKAMKKGHVHDLAYQIAALRKCGLEVIGGGLVVLNKAYVWKGGEHPLDELFARMDLTEECETLRQEIDDEAIRLGNHLGEAVSPDSPINTHCKKCDYADHCLKDLPKDDLIYMIQAKSSTVDKWRAAGYKTIRDIPESKVTDKRMVPTYRVLTTGKRWLSEDLGSSLEAIAFPAAFIDFETCMTAVPAYLGTAPYSQVCFQWSAHLLETPDSDPVHLEFLHPDASDPRPEFCRTLWEAVCGSRNLVIYSAFETTQLKTMEDAGTPFAAELLDKLENSTVDLEKIVSGGVCMEAFDYRTSIKTVLPALVPSMSYKGMAIADGTAAMTEYRRMVDPRTPEEVAAKVREDLLAYCKQDTLAMVEIYRALRLLAA